LQIVLYNLALRTLGDREEAKDVVQDALLQGWVGLPQLERALTFQAWLYRITVNLCRNRSRAHHRKPEAGLDENAVAIAPDNPETTYVDREGQARVRAMILSLSPDLRTAIVLRDINELSYAEISNALGTPIGTVRSRINRARSELRRRILEDGSGRADGSRGA
jgi:RNA polymerase sigma-70 factor (ECF subfamily)